MKEIRYTKAARVWDPLQLPSGSAIKISGYSIENERDFEGDIFLIQSHHWDEMTVISSRGIAYTLYLHELEESTLEQMQSMTQEEIESAFWPSVKIEMLHKYEQETAQLEQLFDEFENENKGADDHDE